MSGSCWPPLPLVWKAIGPCWVLQEDGAFRWQDKHSRHLSFVPWIVQFYSSDLSDTGVIHSPTKKESTSWIMESLPQLGWAVEKLKLNEWRPHCIWLTTKSGQHLSRASLQRNQSHGFGRDAVLCWRHWRLGWSNSWRRGFVSLLSLSKSLGLVVESNSRKKSRNFSGFQVLF